MKSINKFFVDLTPELIEKAQKRVDFIVNEGSKCLGSSENFDSKLKPDWYNEERFLRGQKYLKDFFLARLNSMFVGLLLFLQIPISLVPLLATGRSKNLPKLFNRYLGTYLHVESWFKYDPFNSESEAYKSQALVRELHKKAGELMSKKKSVFEFAKLILEQNLDKELDDDEIVKYIKTKDRVWISQLDMVLVEWSFLGALVLEPYNCGIHNGSKEKLEDIIYTWKVFSYKIGVETRFSLFEDTNYDMCYATCKIIFEQEYLPYIQELSTPLGFKMSEAIVESLNINSTIINFKAFTKFWYKNLNINSYKLNKANLENDFTLTKIEKKNILSEEEKKIQIENGYNGKYIVSNPEIKFEEFELNTFTDKITFSFQSLAINHFLKANLIRNLARKIVKNQINKTNSNKVKFIKQYEKEKKYNFPECPFACKTDD